MYMCMLMYVYGDKVGVEGVEGYSLKVIGDEGNLGGGWGRVLIGGVGWR